jgi:hypothetical protein
MIVRADRRCQAVQDQVCVSQPEYIIVSHQNFPCSCLLNKERDRGITQYGLLVESMWTATLRTHPTGPLYLVTLTHT